MIQIIDITVEIIDIPVAGLNVRQGSRWGLAGADISKVCHRWVVSAAAAGEHIRAVNTIREVSQFAEKDLTRAFFLLKMPTSLFQSVVVLRMSVFENIFN